ncbi:CRINKLY4 related 3 [Euphorbia peplus]|nr:CRINKLY4 related 3 [Euphorbia peplus]
MFVSRNADNPIKVSVWPIVFAFGLLYCRLYGHHAENGPTSHTRRLKRAEKFTLAQLASATNYFSQQNRIRRRNFGYVYRGKLRNGRQVAVVVKRGETGLFKWINEEEVQDGFQEMVKRGNTGLYKLKRSQFEAEVEFISRLPPEHLVRLVGFCEDRDEKLLVYEYMKNGSFYDLLHNKNNFRSDRSIIYKWKMRIKIALDAARGIEYLHHNPVPMIHGDINSSNIMLDANWTAKVCAFGLSLMGPESERGYRPMNVARTVGYTDPEYFRLDVLTSKSDVYSFGVVLLELLTGKRVVFMDGYVRATSLVEFALPNIVSGALGKVLDPRASLRELSEGDAVELVAYTAVHCLNSEGTNRPCMTDVVANLERSLFLCDSSNDVEDEPLLRQEHGNV